MSPTTPTTTEQNTSYFWSEAAGFPVDATSQWGEITLLRNRGWVDVTLHKIADLSHLLDDWDSYGSPPPSRTALKAALSMLAKVDDGQGFLDAPDVMPVSGGGVAIGWSSGSREIEVEFLPNETAEFLTSVDGEPVSDGVLPSVESLTDLLGWLVAA